MPRGQRYTKDQIITALTLYNNLQSMPKVVELLGYPSVSMLHQYIHPLFFYVKVPPSQGIADSETNRQAQSYLFQYYFEQFFVIDHFVLRPEANFFIYVLSNYVFRVCGKIDFLASET